jgi:hypothetical protein
MMMRSCLDGTIARVPYLIRRSLNVGGCAGGHACVGGGEGVGRDGGGVAGRGAGATVAGAELGAGAVASTCLPARSCRIGTLSFVWACPTYRSNSSLLAWRRMACWSASGSLLNRNTSDGVRRTVLNIHLCHH